MTAPDVVEALRLLDAVDVQVLIDGGWGIDALAGTQTRAHADLDVAIDHTRLGDAARALGDAGYVHDPTSAPGLPARYVMRDEKNRQVDLHLIAFDEDGNGWQQLSDADAWGLYPAGERTTGIIDGVEVPCISAELQHRFHLGWNWDEKAKHDMRLLHELFAIPLPPNYAAD